MQPAQLLQTLSQFERALGQFCDLCQHLATIGVEADVLQERERLQPLFALFTSYIWYDAATEIEGVAVNVGHYLGRVGILCRLDALKALAKCGNLRVGVVEERLHRLQLAALNEGFVALHIDDDVGIGANFLGSLLYAVGATLMVGAGHHHASAKRLHSLLDAFVVGSHVSLVEHVGHLFIYSLNNGFSSQHSKGFARKARRSIARRNNAYKLHTIVVFLAQRYKIIFVFL